MKIRIELYKNDLGISALKKLSNGDIKPKDLRVEDFSFSPKQKEIFFMADEISLCLYDKNGFFTVYPLK